MTDDQELASGARSVEAAEHAASGLTQPADPAEPHREPLEALGEHPVETRLGEITLTAVQQGQSVRVRAGNAYNMADLFEGTFDSLEDANYELVQAGILAEAEPLEAGAGGRKLQGVTAEQLQQAGLRRHHMSGL